MQNNILKKLNQYCYNRYFVVLSLFILAFVFGKNMNILNPEQRQLQDEAFAQQKIASGIYSVTLDQDQYVLNKFFSIEKGQCGRLFFDLKNIPIVNNSTDLLTENPNIKILLSNNFDQTQALGTYKIKSNRFIQNEEVEFCGDADYSSLLFQKDEDSLESSFEISNVSFYSLPLEKHNFNNILTPIVGDTDFSKIIYQSALSTEDATIATKFTRRNQIIGQTFVADSDIISGVDSKLEFMGVGGIGNYYLELREINNQNGKVTLSSDRIAYFSFNKDSAERDLKLGEGVYHIPLAAHLVKGRTYFIGINNEAVKFNILNTLKIYGGNAGSGEKIVFSIGGKVGSKPGKLFLKTYGADYVKTGDEKVLTGAKILGNGDGTGSYIYGQRGNFSDYLDLEQTISKEKTSIFYDNVQAGISGRDEDDNAFVYKINTIYPFIKMKIEAWQPGGEFTDSLVYYSFDNQNWTEIKNDYDKDDALPQADPNKFNQLIKGDGTAKMVYLKITYDKDDAKGKTSHFFGLKNLKVVAEIRIMNNEL